MDLNKITAGRNPPKEIHAFIEIPFGGVPVKYELDKESGALHVDRFLHTAMFYQGITDSSPIRCHLMVIHATCWLSRPLLWFLVLWCVAVR